MLVSHILSSKSLAGVLTASPGDTVSDIAEILSEKRIGALIVSETGEDVAGIISERDIVRELGAQGAGCLQDTVSALMTASVVTCAPTDSAQSVMVKMTEGRFRHMPVVEGQRLIGVISIGDVVKARMEEMAQENSALTDMISGNA